jgi:hypothetical protein
MNWKGREGHSEGNNIWIAFVRSRICNRLEKQEKYFQQKFIYKYRYKQSLWESLLKESNKQEDT